MSLQIPVQQMGLLALLTCMCFLFSRYRLGMAVVFGFAFYWGYVCNSHMFLNGDDGSGFKTIIYVSGGLVLIFLALIAFLAEMSLATKRRMGGG